MKTLSFRDVEQISAYLDGQLSRAESARLDIRLKAAPGLAAVLYDLQTARAILRRTPKRRSPRNFTLTPKMAGLRPPVPRAVPTLSWASAMAMLLFVCTLGTNLLGRLSFGASAPMLSAAPAGTNGQSDSTYGVGGGPAATEPAMESAPAGTPTAELMTLMVPEATQPAEPTPAPDSRNIQPPGTTKTSNPSFPWLWIWPGLSGLLLASALVIRWLSVHSFHNRNK